MFDDYREIPLKLFIKVLNNESEMERLLPSIDTGTWKVFKDKFEADNPSDEDIVIVEKQQRVLYPESKIQLYKTLIQFCLVAPGIWERLFDEAGVSKKETLFTSIAYLNKQINKEQVRFNISNAELKQFLKDMPERERTEYNIFDVISSLSAVTGNRLDYNTATIGELLAEQKLAKRIADKYSRNGG
jgi:hypothetical protein